MEYGMKRIRGQKLKHRIERKKWKNLVQLATAWEQLIELQMELRIHLENCKTWLGNA